MSQVMRALKKPSSHKSLRFQYSASGSHICARIRIFDSQGLAVRILRPGT